MSDEELAFVLKYSTPKEILIINYENRLVRLVCPFSVIAINDVGSLVRGKVYKVDSVLVDDKIVTVFRINEHHFFYHHFTIC